MVNFNSDYICGAHPKVLEALVDTNLLCTPGYGEDEFSNEAKDIIRAKCSAPDAEVYFFVGGTQTNAVAIDGLIRPYEGVIATDTSHIFVHEGGSVEACGHKIIALPNCDGKMRAEDLEAYMHALEMDDSRWHMVIPGMVYLTFATELGTIYTLDELRRIRSICDRYGLRLFVDGARLAYGLAAEGNDVTMADLAAICDAFYIGGTKAGLLFGEALVAKPGMLTNFFTQMKLHGAVLAKGRLLGVQFAALMRDGLFDEIGRHAVKLAMRLRDGFAERGIMPVVPSPTNQQFFSMPNSMISELRKKVAFENFGPAGKERTNVRFVTGWSTTEADIDYLLSALK